jgi:hypothetical protein
MSDETTGLEPAVECPDADLPARRVQLKSERRRGQRPYVPALPLGLFERACVLPGKALAVYLVLWRQAHLEGRAEVVLTSARLRQHGLNRQAKRAARRQLEAAGLVRIEPRGRRNPAVTVLDFAPRPG